MKRKLILLFLTIVFISGCGNKKINLVKINDALINLKEETFDISSVPDNILKENSVFNSNDMEIKYVYDMDNYGISSSNIAVMSAMFSSSNSDFYIVASAIDDKNEKYLEKDLSAFCNKRQTKDKKCYSTKMKKYYVYIISNNNEKIMNIISNSQKKVFGKLNSIKDYDLSKIGGLSNKLIDDYLINVPMSIESSGYIIIKPSKGNKKNVEKAIDNYYDGMKENFKSYMKEQSDLIDNRLKIEINGYLIYIVSNNNQLVLDTIKSNIK